MTGILMLESLTRGNTLKQGDKTPLTYKLLDADGDNLNIAGKSATVRLVHPNYLTIGYEKSGLLVSQDDTVTFIIDNVIPARKYNVEIIVDNKFVFPSRSVESKFTIDKSTLGTEANIIEIVGVDEVVRRAVELINIELPGGGGGSYDDTDVRAHMGNTNNPHNVTKSQVGLGNVNNTSDANKPVSTAMQSALNNKADKSQVLTNVPANAKFTDTTYTAGTGINIAGGVISATGGGEDGYDDTSVVNHMNDQDNPHGVTKGQVGLGNVNNTSDINKPISSAVQLALDKKADSSQVLTNVPANAKFTDTIYTHPGSHPASMITETSAKRFVSDAEKTAWNSKTDDSAVNTHMASKANPHGVTKAQVGLGSVSNVAQASKPEFDTHNADTTKHITASERTVWNNKQDALGFTAENTSNKGQAGGYASLDSTGRIPVTQLPDFESGDVGTVGIPQTISKTGDTVTLSDDGGSISLSEYAKANQVLTNVPANAKFTDTVYTHPNSHPASMITESSTKRFVSDAEKTAWNAKTDDTTIDAHIARKNNPHNVTKEQVGLGSVLNYGLATQAEAEAGISSAKYMTPLRTQQAIDKTVGDINAILDTINGEVI